MTAAKLKPKALKPGSVLHVVSPASPIDDDILQKGLKVFESWGYKIKLGRHVLNNADYLAGTDEERAADLMAAFGDAEADAVLCSRGGYGCARLFPHLDLDRMAASGKMFLGFSDITSLHFALNKRGLVTFYAPMVMSFAYDKEPYAHESMRRMVVGNHEIPSEAPNGTCVISGIAEGETTGGCMCLICDSISTPESIDTKGKILCIEDVDEAPHRIDAMFTHLLNAGMLQQCAGILIGEMTRTDERVDEGIGGRPWREIVTERLEKAGVPSIIDFPFGHVPGLLTMPFGIRARLNADAGTLEYLESPCAD